MKAVKGKPFFQGVHVHDMKYLAENSPSEVFPEPDTVCISLSQSLGRPAEPCVAVGDLVKEGQPIGKAAGPISSDVFASIAGKVTAVQQVAFDDGRQETYVTITKSDEISGTDYLPPLENPTAEEIRKRMKDAGIVGMGGAGFPTAVKIVPPTPVDTLLINAAECEPYLTCDDRLMKEHADGIYRGARYIASSMGVENIIIGIEANKPKCIEMFEAIDGIKVVILKKRYPMGGEKQLIYVTTGRKVGVGKLPSDSGCLVQNVATCFAACEAIEKGKPLYERIVTVSGKSVKEPKNLWVRVGTCVKDIIEYCGGETESLRKLVIGGPMTGFAVAGADVYTRKTMGGILLMSKKEVC
ncbi:MAG: RnfABCDGE type electron transport complex subunit C, partial [Clostridia bacterium]|nr:RnfABCDGE type electron transport complex subunit C [Clostridia bacterium]